MKAKSWLVEAKRTDSRQYILKPVVLKRLVTSAILEGKRPVMVIDFGSPHERYAVIPWDVATEFINADLPE